MSFSPGVGTAGGSLSGMSSRGDAGDIGLGLGKVGERRDGMTNAGRVSKSMLDDAPLGGAGGGILGNSSSGEWTGWE